MLDYTSHTLYTLKEELLFIILGSFYMFMFSPYIFNCKDAEFNKAIQLPEDPSYVYMVNESE